MIKCQNIKKYFSTGHGFSQKAGVVRAVDDVSLEIEKGEAFGLVGESGSGKTTLGKIILGILKPDSGEVALGTRRVQVIFQDPHNSLDPKMRVRDIIAEGLVVRKDPSLRARRRRAKQSQKNKVEEILDLVQLPKTALNKYPHQFSGGERQRIAIARAVITEPEFIVCDEPVSSLDVTIQLQILNLLKEIRERLGVTYLFISHDLRVIRFMCGRVAVMKEGKIVEQGPADKIYSTPGHPYTRFLLSSILKIL